MLEERVGSKPRVLLLAAGLFPAPSRSAARCPDRGSRRMHRRTTPREQHGLLWKSSP